ncbi:hypothetical protein P691DRAFT_802613 [Macrolepiota fuliginosa MF-IS2]|uniref:Cep57 centrosome microtubule-binding domain-containing protein n=1 Tax=Macrolepiota fuliginosa MF-IS2 TaxID=1400762 RepID=A0A9P6C0F6_9AGAR|nr:hypothetical protein P691DRAFT_802613 [Macrolepiota fuliginosa MF-IS2]
MRRSTRQPAPFIPNDELEAHRIRLEHNLRHSETTIHLSSATESDAESYQSADSLEYPRHNSNPASMNEFPSFDRRVRDHLADEDIPGHGWSYRTGDDYEEGINPYGGESLSTVAHHASAVTLSAGLGGRGARRDISISGAEYDPDRPLNDIIAGVTSKLSVFDTDVSRSKRITLENITNDPLIVEDTAELDQILETGARPSMHSRSVRVASPVTSGSSSHSESDHGQANTTAKGRPKFSDALRDVTLSPKRPRSPQINRSISFSPKQQPVASISRGSQRANAPHVPTPRPGRRSNIFPSYAPSPPQQPDLVLQPPTPSEVSSKFTRMAHGLAKEIEHEKNQLRASTSSKRTERSRSASMPIDNNLFHDGANQATSSGDRANLSRSSAKNRSRIQLPDVTGLTNAIESPAKLTAEYYAYRAEDQIRATEKRLLHTLDTVQRKIQQLEEENGISRRRVRELEMELEDCKREVARERTRLIEQEESFHQQQKSVRAKGKARARDLSTDASLLHERYKEVVEEKKALEDLINKLRAHLTRVTSELSSNRELLIELRMLRDVDSNTLRDKGLEITRLRNEVERLAGEVEVLRSVVEEGLRERRAAKEASLEQSSVHDEFSRQEPSMMHLPEEEHDMEEEEEDEDEYDGEDTETEDAAISVTSSSRARAMDRTMRTDHATEGSTNDVRRAQYLDPTEFERISAEIDERRSDRSGSANLSQFSQTRSPVQSPSPRPRRNRPADNSAVYDMSTMARRASSPEPISDPEEELGGFGEHDTAGAFGAGPSTRPREYFEDHEPQPNRRHRNEVEAPFPKIRGEHLERLFFAAPEHDARTCSTCNRNRHESDGHPAPSRNARRTARSTRSRRGSDGDDEGFAEGSEELEQPQAPGRDKGKRRELENINEVRSVAQQEGLPPQTIVARIIRELEDDFTHYKSIYVELADQYKEMDAASNVAKRNTLAKHLREVVDILELKGDQIASLYDLLSFKDKPPVGRGSQKATTSSGKAAQTRT